MEHAGIQQRLTLEARSHLEVTGVTEVVSFTDTAVALRTELGALIVQGRGLQLKELSLEGGLVAVDGQVSALIYEEEGPARGWLSRLLG